MNKTVHEVKITVESIKKIQPWNSWHENIVIQMGTKEVHKQNTRDGNENPRHERYNIRNGDTSQKKW